MTNEPTEKRLEEVRKGQLIVMTPEEWNAEQRAVPVFTPRERKVRPIPNPMGIEKRKDQEELARLQAFAPKAVFMMDKPPPRFEVYRQQRNMERQAVLEREAEKNVMVKGFLHMMKKYNKEKGYKSPPWEHG